jgi:hypothetical protein
MMTRGGSEMLPRPVAWCTVTPFNTRNTMDEIIFLVEESPEGGFTARALGHSIFTDAEAWADLAGAVRKAVACHFEDAEAPRLIRLHLVRDEVITA